MSDKKNADHNTGAQPDAPEKMRFDEGEVVSLKGLVVDQQRGDEGQLHADVCHFQWSVAWARAIAEYWREKTLDERPFSELLLNDPRLAFKQLGYDLPSGMNLTIKETTEVSYCHSIGANGWDGDLAALRADVTMYLPPAPADVSQYARALEDYNATGLSVPFTS